MTRKQLLAFAHDIYSTAFCDGAAAILIHDVIGGDLETTLEIKFQAFVSKHLAIVALYHDVISQDEEKVT